MYCGQLENSELIMIVIIIIIVVVVIIGALG